MKKYLCIWLPILLLFFSSFATAQSTSSTHKLAGGARGHASFPGIDNLPLEKGDYSYLLMYEYHESKAFWQFGASYAPAPSDDRFEYIITPQMNLIFKDKIFRLGGGVMTSRVKTANDSDWTNMLWQICFGLEIPLGSRIGIDIYGYYVYESWKTFTDSDKTGLEYSALLSIAF